MDADVSIYSLIWHNKYIQQNPVLYCPYKHRSLIKAFWLFCLKLKSKTFESIFSVGFFWFRKEEPKLSLWVQGSFFLLAIYMILIYLKLLEKGDSVVIRHLPSPNKKRRSHCSAPFVTISWPDNNYCTSTILSMKF